MLLLFVVVVVCLGVSFSVFVYTIYTACDLGSFSLFTNCPPVLAMYSVALLYYSCVTLKLSATVAWFNSHSVLRAAPYSLGASPMKLGNEATYLCELCVTVKRRGHVHVAAGKADKDLSCA